MDKTLNEIRKLFKVLWKHKTSVIITIQAMIIVWSFAADYYYLPKRFEAYKKEQVQKERVKNIRLDKLENHSGIQDEKIRINRENDERMVLLLQTISNDFRNILKEYKKPPEKIKPPIDNSSQADKKKKEEDPSILCKIATLGIGDCK